MRSTEAVLEILRAGLVDDELYVTARRVFTDPATWGEVLADIARRLALLHSAEGEYEEAEVLAAIESAFAADLGAPVIKDAPRPARKKARKSPARATRAKKPARRAAPKRAKIARQTARQSRQTQQTLEQPAQPMPINILMPALSPDDGEGQPRQMAEKGRRQGQGR